MTSLTDRKKQIYETLLDFNGNMWAAAKELDMDYVTLSGMCKKDPMFAIFKSGAPPLPPRAIKPKEMPMPTTQVAVKNESSNLNETFNTKDVIQTLSQLMVRVTEKDCSPDTVNAACNCAGKITEILRMHLDVERLKQKIR